MGCLGSFIYILYILFDINNGQSIYVDGSASYPYYGTSTQPFKTIQDGIDFAVLNRFDTVLVRDGTYTPKSTITIPSSENLKYIISENGSNHTIITKYGFDVKSQSNKQTITIQGFTMQFNTRYGAAAVQIGTQTTIIDLRLNINGGQSMYSEIYGIKTQSNQYINIVNSTIYFPYASSYTYAVYAVGQQYSHYQSNFIMRNVSISGSIIYVKSYGNIHIDGAVLNNSNPRYNYQNNRNYLG